MRSEWFIPCGFSPELMASDHVRMNSTSSSLLAAALLILVLASPATARAQSDDAAYCTKLSDLYRHHIGDMGIGSVSPDVTAATAMSNAAPATPPRVSRCSKPS